MSLKEFYPGTNNYKKIIWLNRYFDRVMKLHDVNKKKLLNESINWGSDEHIRLRKLQNRIHNKIYLLARYSSLLTSKALN